MRRSKTIFIVGGSGFIGTHLCYRLREKYKVFGTFYKHPMKIPGVTMVPFDIANRDWVKRVIYTIKPEVVIYAAGKNDLNWSEENTRISENVHTAGAGYVSTTADIFKPKFIYLSNSYIFDGKKGNYKAEDIVLPWTNLGKNKLNSENYIKGRSLNHLILRTAPVLGRGNGYNISFLDKLRKILSAGNRIELPDNELHGFAPIYGLVDLIYRLVESGPRNKVLHYGGLTKLSHYQLAVLFAKRFGFDDSLIIPVKIAQDLKSKQEYVYDYSLNCTEVAETLNAKPYFIEEAFDLLEQKLIPGDVVKKYAAVRRQTLSTQL